MGLLLLAVLLLLFGSAPRLVRLALGGRDEGGLLQHTAGARGGDGEGRTGRACGRRGVAGLVRTSQPPSVWEAVWLVGGRWTSKDPSPF